MGRPYAREVNELKMTYSHALETPIDKLVDFVGMATRTPLYAVGSGGSLTASVLASVIHQEAGFMARYITPMELLNSQISHDASVLVISAGGNNKDILSAFEMSVTAEPANLGVLCASANNRLTRRAELLPHVFLSRAATLKKDGFLATNSLLAMSIWLARAYETAMSLEVGLPSSMDDLVHSHMDEQGFVTKLGESITEIAGRSTVIALYDNIGKVAAMDLESKLVEAGLCNVQLSDYRNFAHGRHNWIDKNPDNTAVISIISPECRALASKTMRLVPNNVPAAEISTERTGLAGILSLLIQVMYAIKMFGDSRGIDPGRPSVAEFGRRIYRIGMPKPKIDVSAREVAIKRKFGAVNKDAFEVHLQILEQFVRRIEKMSFDAVVFDYDGTLCDAPRRRDVPSSETSGMLAALVQKGVPVGIATGRGRSIKVVLRKIIPKKSWHRVFVGYYNCADVASLDEDDAPDINSSTDPDLARLADYLIERGIITMETMEERPNQISLHARRLTAMNLIREINTSNPQMLTRVKIVESGRSVDILPARVSKTAILVAIKKAFGCRNILCIGDQGLWPGNDSELLSTPFSLSVDKTSRDPNSCWNLAPLGYVGERATQYYMDLMYIQNKKIQIKYIQEYM